MPKTLRRAATVALLSTIAFLTTFALFRIDFFKTLELKTVDYRFLLLGPQRSASDRIVLVEIDNPSLKALESQEGVGRWPWPRDVHAVLIDFMKRAEARAVVFDVTFTEEHDSQFDQILADSGARFGRVVHAILPTLERTTPPDPGLLEDHSLKAVGHFPQFIQIDFPIPPVAAASRALGHVAMTLDPDGPWRRYLPIIRYQDRNIPALGLATALLAEDVPLQELRLEGGRLQAGRISIPLDEDGRLPIWYNGGPATYKTYSFHQVFLSELQIQAEEAPLLSPDLFRDRIVLVGVSASGLGDLFTTPFSGGSQDAPFFRGVRLGKMPGVEVHAHVLDNLLSNRYLRKPPGWASHLLAWTVSLLVLAAVFYVRLWAAAALFILTLSGYLLAAQLAFHHHWDLPVLPVALSSGNALLLGLAYQYWVEGAEKRKIKRIFSRYVSKDVYHELLHNPAAAELGGKRSTVTVLFSDLRGFTTMSENRPPEDIIAQLNEYFSEMVTIVFAHRGTIDKFVGDMIMALFNAPLGDDNHADHAVQCALAMNRKLTEMGERWRQRGLPVLRAGVGINTGEMIVGNVGAESIRSYTVIGDNVNLGARLESLCKEYDSDIIISEFTRTLLKQDYCLRELDDVVVKGKSKPVKIFQVRPSQLTADTPVL